jgi:hypothetical protein
MHAGKKNLFKGLAARTQIVHMMLPQLHERVTWGVAVKSLYILHLMRRPKWLFCGFAICSILD